MSFYSLVSTLKDKSSQAMATLSSDLKDFTAIIQEDVAEVATTVRKTVQERNDAAAAAQANEAAAAERTRAASSASSVSSDRDDAPPAEPLAAASTKLHALFSSIGGYTLETSFGALKLGDVGSKLLHTADGLLGALANDDSSDKTEDTDDATVLAARRFRLLALQEDVETYVTPPADTATFLQWRDATLSATLDALQSDVLATAPAVVDKFAELVPSAVDADTFWTHYLYKASLLAAQEQRGAELLEHALNDSDEEIGWGDADSPRQNDSDNNERRRPAAGSFFVEDESKDESVALGVPQPAAAKPDSSSSDGESWIELDERKDQQAPLSTSSVASSAPDATAATGPKPAGVVMTAAAAVDEDDDEEMDWGDDDIVPDDGLSSDETNGATATVAAAVAAAPELHDEPKKRAGDWGDWD